MRAYPAYLVLRAVGSFAGGCALAYTLLYQIDAVGLGPVELVLVGTVLEIVHLVAQVPTGILADRRGRRPAVVAGTLLLGAGSVVQGAAPTMTAVLAGTVIGAVGSACVDGAEQAWIAGEVGDDRAGPVFGRGAQVGQVSLVAGIGAGALLCSGGLGLPLLVGGDCWLGLGLLLAAVLPENRTAPAPRPAGVRVRPSAAMVPLLGAVFVLGLGSEGWDRLGPVHLLSFAGIGPGSLGLLAAGGMVGAAILTGVIRRRLDGARAGRLLLAVETTRLAALVAFALSGSVVVAAPAWLLAGSLVSVRGPVLDTWLVSATEPATRATVLSVVGQADSAGQILGGPPVGMLGAWASVRVALLCGALTVVPALALFRRAGRRAGVGGRA